MDRLRATNSVNLAGADLSPGAGTPQYATDGNPATPIPATRWPAYAFNQLQEELMAIVERAGITPDDALWNQVLQVLMVLPGKNCEVFVASGTFTPAALITRVRVRCWGAGGAGGSASGAGAAAGGAAGGYGEGFCNVTPAVGETVTIGAGGAHTTGSGNGAAGGTTSFGTLIVCTGGAGGLGQTTGAQAATAAGGTVSGAGATMFAGAGQVGGRGLTTGGIFLGGIGGAPIFFPATPMTVGTGANGALGAGGGGGCNTSVGGDGGGGCVVVEW